MGTLGFSIIVFLLYAKLFTIGSYPVTVGGLFVPVFLVRTLLKNAGRLLYLPHLAFLLCYPMVVYAIHILLQTPYAVPLSRFLLSYSLWIVSMTLIWSAFQPIAILRLPNPTVLLWILLALGITQYIGLRYFGSTAAYDIIQPISTTSFHSGYTDVVREASFGNYRAVGSYYEPSMFGRVTATLAMILLAGRKRGLLFLLYTLVAFWISSSLTILVLSLVALLIYLRAMKNRILGFVLVAVFVAGVVWPAVHSRLGLSLGGAAGGTDWRNSLWIRLVLPIHVVMQVLPSYPYGLPIGSNAAMVTHLQLLGDLFNFDEGKITNGFFEVVFYFGVMILVPLAFCARSLVNCIRQKNLPMALAVLYLLMATPASGSFLSIESSLLIAFFIIAMRQVRELDLQEQQIGSEEQEDASDRILRLDLSRPRPIT